MLLEIPIAGGSSHLQRMRLSVFLLLLCSVGAGAQDDLFLPAIQGQRIDNASYIVDYDNQGRIPHWVAYELKASELQGAAKRGDNFRVDPRVERSAPAKWPGSGYDRGHMKPAADSKGSAAEMSSSFLMTNMAPQTPALNRGEWKGVEELVRAWSAQFGEVYVVMGASKSTHSMLAQNVRVPTHFWKAVLRYGADTAAVAFLFPNAKEVPGTVADYRVTVDSLEAFMGLDLFAALPDSTERIAEAGLGQWNLGQKTPASVKGGSSPSGAATSQRCTGWSKSKGGRCSNKTKHPSGRCHHHRN